MRYVFDATGRFTRRPHYEASELDAVCEDTVRDFLRERYGEVRYPVLTNDLTILLEKRTRSLDLYADLSGEGHGVEGVTYFQRGGKSDVSIAAELSEERWRENRFRTTLSHELGHVVFHSHLWALDAESLPLFDEPVLAPPPARCFRRNMLAATRTDWMEWQAGFSCGAFLMPAGELRVLLADLIGGAPPIVDDARAQLMIARTLASFAVSADAARVRLYQTGYVARQPTFASI